jgi:hypothetical protein
MRVTNRGRALIYSVGIVCVVAGVGFLVWYLLQPSRIVEAKMVNKPPTIDGKAGDPAWAAAKSINLPQGDTDSVDIKAAYTKDRVYFLARFKSKAPIMADRVWTYDGKNWKNGGPGDQLGLFFEVKDTMPEFEDKGFDIMTFGFKKEDNLWQFGINGPKSQSGIWSGAKQKADYWVWGAGGTNPWGKAADMFYSIDRGYLASPALTDPVLFTNWDTFRTAGVLATNSNLWRQAMRVGRGTQDASQAVNAPIFIYKEGKSFQNDPYPVFDDLMEIPEGYVFKKGDRLPYIIFDGKAKGLWGASRDDVDAKGAWKDGYWTIELSRKLNTKYQDDIVFSKPGKDPVNYWFGVLTRTGGTINKSIPARLRLMPNGGN